MSLFTLFVFVCAYLMSNTYCFVFLRLLYHMLLVSLDCSLLIVPSVFSIVYIYDTRTQMFGIIQYIPTVWYVFGFHLANLIEL